MYNTYLRSNFCVNSLPISFAFLILFYSHTTTKGVPFDAPPIKYRYICLQSDHKNCTYAPSSGSLSFKVLNRRTEYVFVYVSGSSTYRNIKAISNVVTFEDLNIPMNPHIAIIPNSNSNVTTSASDDLVAMQIIWVQKSIDTKSLPRVHYGTSKTELKTSVKAFNYHEYKISDMCDTESGQIAGLSGWFEPGFTVTADLYNLKPNTKYFYAITAKDSSSDSDKINEIFNFTTQPVAGQGRTSENNQIKFVAFGDLGNVAIDYSFHHSWDWYNHGELYSINTTTMIAKNYMSSLGSVGINNTNLRIQTDNTSEIATKSDNSHFLLHIGDISYAVGYLSEWDDFLHQIKPIASHIPYMTGIGNHEYSHSNEWNPGKIPATKVASDAYSITDGNGECGVPYNTYFPFANQDPLNARKQNYNYANVEPWYSFEYGFVKIIMISTEHDYGVDSNQYKWFENELKNTDRSLYPWIIVGGHRPMYANSKFDGDTTTGDYLRTSLEGLFKQYGVAIGLWGHQHSYGRTCAVYDQKCTTTGTTHFVIGMAGYKLSKEIPNPPVNNFQYASNDVYGFTHYTIYNHTHALVKFINSKDGSVADHVYVVNPYKSS